MSVIKITKDNFKKEALSANEPVLVDFWAPWCGYCRQISPAIDQLAENYTGKLRVGKINTDEQPDLAEQFQVMTIPTLLLFQNGKVSAPLVAPKTKGQIDSWLKENGAV